MIEVVDTKGRVWNLIPIGRYKVSQKGLVERWAIAGPGPGDLRKYHQIPLPVFTEWWP